jgi:predicted anti-sigma-YlaC factor YlaD
MSDQHLTEEELQEFALNEASITKAASAHLHACPVCREQLATYRQLFIEIETEPAAAFDFDVSEAVMEKLPVRKQIKLSVSFFMLMAVLMITVAVILLFGEEMNNLFTGIDWLVPVLILISVITAAAGFAYDVYKNYRTKIEFINSLQ